MLTVPWDAASLSIVYVLCSIAGLCFCFVLYKIWDIKNTELFKKLSAFLIYSQILYILETVFGDQVTKTLAKNPD